MDWHDEASGELFPSDHASVLASLHMLLLSNATLLPAADDLILPPCLPACLPLQVEGMLDSLKTAMAAPTSAAEAKAHAANEGFLQDEGSRQQLMLKCAAFCVYTLALAHVLLKPLRCWLV